MGPARAQAGKPGEVVAAESSNSPVRDEAEIVATIEAFNLGVALYTAAARALLAPHDGYECKEPEPGKLTLAFRRGRAALPPSPSSPAPRRRACRRGAACVARGPARSSVLQDRLDGWPVRAACTASMRGCLLPNSLSS